MEYEHGKALEVRLMYIKHRVHSYLKVLADYIENLTTKTVGNNSCICAAPGIKLNN